MGSSPAGRAPAATPLSPTTDSATADARWLLSLRWVAVVAQALVVLYARFLLHLHLPVAILSLLIASVAASNLWLRLRTRRQPLSPGAIAAVMAFDTTVLTALLALSGGIQNPFSALYVVNIALAATLLGGALTWVLVAYSVLSYGSLFLLPNAHAHHLMAGTSPVHLQGMWLAFSLVSVVIAGFVTRITRELERRRREVIALQRRAATDEKLAALSTLAAGAAHELGSPLGTMALIAEELVAWARRETLPEPLREDAKLLLAQIHRCRDILHQMSADAGEAVGEVPIEVELRELLAALPGVDPARLEVEEPDGPVRLRVPRRAFRQVLGNLLKNALEAGDGPVRLRATKVPEGIRLELIDRGPGMSDEVLARVGEPFFTTKPAGRGMGLGVFLARAVVERLGGSFQIQSASGEGTTVTLELRGRE